MECSEPGAEETMLMLPSTRCRQSLPGWTLIVRAVFFEEQLVMVFLQNPFGESKDHVEPQVAEESGRLGVG